MLDISFARQGDAITLASYLRDADRREILTVSGKHPLVVLTQAVALSKRCYTVRYRNTYTNELRKKPIIIFGVASSDTNSQRGLVWLMASDAINLVKKDFTKHFPAMLVELMRGFMGVECWVDSRNTLHHRWTQSFGFMPLDMRLVTGVTFIHMYRANSPE